MMFSNSTDSYHVTETVNQLPSPNNQFQEMFRILYIVIPAFGLPGNMLAIMVMASDKEMRKKPVNIFMIHQSAIDFCACLVLMLTKLYDSIDVTSSSAVRVLLCRFWVTSNVMWGCVTCSVGNLLLLTLERYWATNKPLQYNSDVVKRRLPVVFPMLWLVGMAIQFPKFVSTRVVNGRCIPYNDIKGEL